MAYQPSLADNVSKVRFEIGDVFEDEDEKSLLTDTFIEGVLAAANDNVLLAAERCAWFFHAKYSHQPDEVQGGPQSLKTQVGFQRRAAHWRRIYDELRMRRTKAAARPVAYGTAAHVERARNDPSTVQSIFVGVGEMSNPAAGGSSVNGRGF